MRRSLILTSIVMFVLGINLNLPAQTASGNLQQGYTTFGLNAGKAYQSSDVKIDPKGFGFGLTLGKNLYYRPGATLSFDVRSRFLYTQSYGLDRLKNHSIDNDPSVNGTYGLDYLVYPESTGVTDGYIFSNHKTSHGELAGEGVLTLNKLKEETGVKVSLYGGLGLDWYNVKTDQADANGMPYYDEYANLNDAAPTGQVIDKLKGEILDGTYETDAGGFESGWGKAKIMPSLGAEIGFQVTPKFSIDFGHRMTFTGRDNFDGDMWSESGNDLLHYTYGGLNFNINKSAPKVRTPKIDLIRPNRNVITTTQTSFVVEADIDNVNSAADITFQIDGQDRAFNFNKNDFLSNIYLSPGKHEIFLSASNTAGYDTENITVFVEQEHYDNNPPVIWDNPPVVAFTSPTGGLYESNSNRITLIARVENIDDKNQIRLWKDGRSISFSFDRRSGRVTAETTLLQGENLFRIEARNTDGLATDEIRINYVEPIAPPTVNIEQPQNNYRTLDNNIDLVAYTAGVLYSNDIRLLVNGQLRDFTFDRGKVRSNLALNEGNNMVEIEVRNPSGTDRDQVLVIRDRERPVFYPPTINIIRPANNWNTENSSIELLANVDGVDSKRDITLLLNNRTISNFNFTRGQVTANILLREGVNTIEVKASNRGGNTTDKVHVKLEKKIIIPDPVYPEVNIRQPFEGQVFEKPTTRLIASTLHVTSGNQIEVRLNNTLLRGIDFRNNTINTNLNLQKGWNLVEVIVRNDDGTDKKFVNIEYRPQVKVELPQPPVVEIITPKDKSTFDQAMVNFEGQVKHVSRKADIELFVNNKRVEFAFAGTKVTARLNLGEGSNLIKLVASNKDGKEDASVVVRLKEMIAPPTVRITRPNDNSKVAESELDFAASVTGVKDKGQVKLLVNRSAVAFNFEPISGKVVATLFLKKGANQVEIQVSNETARAMDKIKVTYTPLPAVKVPDEVVIKNKPEIEVISISQPTIDPTNPQKARSTLVAKLKFVEKASDISVTVNGNKISNFLFATSGSFQVTFPVEPGRNTLVMTAKNGAGTTTITRYVDLGINTGEGEGLTEPIGENETIAEPVKPAPGSVKGKNDEKENKIKRRW